MEGIDVILQAEKDADCIRQKGKEAAAALLKAAEEQRQQMLEDARVRGEAEMERLAAQGKVRAENRCMELEALAAVRDEELRERAGKAMDKTAAWLAERMTEV